MVIAMNWQEAAAVALAAGTAGSVVAGGLRNIGGFITWLQAYGDRREQKRKEAREGLEDWSERTLERLQARLDEQEKLADEAAAMVQALRETVAVVTVWAKAAHQVIVMNDLTHLIDPPPISMTGGPPWTNPQPTVPPSAHEKHANSQPPCVP